MEKCIHALGINQMCQWDVLVFLHWHRTTLLSADKIARYMSYGAGSVIAALDHLEAQGLVERSRLSRGARLYQLTAMDDPRGSAFNELLRLTETRAGRLRMMEKLKGERSSRMVVSTKHLAKPRPASVESLKERAVQSTGGRRWPQAI